MRKEYLKIRDDVDLQELEKFGFVLYGQRYGLEVYHYRHKDDTLGGADMWIRHKPYSREICFAFNSVDNETLCVLFDLILAGLVEKISRTCRKEGFIEQPENSIFYDASLYIETEGLRKFLDKI